MKSSSPTERERGALDPYDENAADCAPLKPAGEMKADDIVKLQIDLRDAKSKLRTMTQKFAMVRKERDTLKKETKDLQTEVMTLQTNMREMIPGFSNTSSIYPMHNELLLLVSDFLKCSCEDIFFDLLSPELSMEGVVYFFKESLGAAHRLVTGYFDPTMSAVCRSTGCDKVEGPLLNVLKKVYQNNWKRVFASCVSTQQCEEVMRGLQSKLSLGDCSSAANRAIIDFVKKLCEVYFLTYISEPEFVYALETMGSKVQFNPLRHESIDGFVKSKEQCVLILPTVHKHSSSGEIIVKGRVLPVNYQFS